MRLKSIKLAGFKSFVDPTTIPFPGNLSSIVGPNGCGKSNVIDAVRWVMGESSAKNLRGESMADVIFNGSHARKPVAQASVELIFDNSEGRLGGEYSKYSEIAIKRLASREGQSQYYLNGSRCRRKDIHDIFLGTGLGPRSYAIIGQGMISRLVEAKPDELRIFIEEAAGISKYKERRRETENRMRHTRENLDRLEDLKEELARQLEKLQGQAKAAEKYQSYKAEERLKRAQLHAMKWLELEQSCTQTEAAIREFEVALEAVVTDRTRTDRDLEHIRTQYQEQNGQVSHIQERYYRQGTELAKLEQSLQHLKERHAQFNEDLQQTESALAQAQAHKAQDESRLQELRTKLETLEPDYALAQAEQEEAQIQLEEQEERMQSWQDAWDVFNKEAFQAQQQAQVQQSRIEHLEKTLDGLYARAERLEHEKDMLSDVGLTEEVAQWRAQAEQAQTVQAQLQADREARMIKIKAQREQNQQQARELDALKQTLQAQLGRKSSLETLQEAALGKDQSDVSQWLTQNGLTDCPRLGERIAVEPGWEKALETVLSQDLQALCVSALQPVMEALDDLGTGSVTLVAENSGVVASRSSDLLPLTSKLRGACNSSLVQNIFVALDLESALRGQVLLEPGQSIITQQGLWLGRDWVKVNPVRDANLGVLQRQQALQEIEQTLQQAQARSEQLQAQLQEGRTRLQELEETNETLNREQQQSNQRLAELKSQLGAREERLTQLKARRERIERDLVEIEQQQERESVTLSQARDALETAVNLMGQQESRRETLKEEQARLKAGLEQARMRAASARDSEYQLALELKTLQTNRQAAEQNLARLNAQLETLWERQAKLQQQINDNPFSEPEWLSQREALLIERLEIEALLEKERRALETLGEQLRSLEASRNQSETKAAQLREQLEEKRLAAQGMQVERKYLADQLAEAECEPQSVLAELPEDARIAAWEAALEKLQIKIQRLGPINLVAIEEYEAALERKTYLDMQQADLVEALTTLETAIRKIDKETRDRFKETYDIVNEGLQTLFPKVFGGGSAYLDLTGEDLLETGVSIMARPPGKRNSTIHLLSGGEKALTAIALVFAIFQLNPAPFCMLDEVDAPLDDANVGRFCRLVEEMARTIQFIYITHNKIAMEMAERLMGVTMHEPGVSRLVSVDIEEAVAMAAV